MSKVLIEEAWRAGVQQVSGEYAVRKTVLDTGLQGAVKVAAVGKAAASMTLGLIRSGVELRSGIVVTKYGHLLTELDSFPNVALFQAAHPVPDYGSLQAGAALKKFVDGCSRDDQLVVLVSGGASALAEQLVDGETLESLQQKTQALLSEGRDIAAINAVRRELSQLKGGKLLIDCPATVRSWMLSDVQGDDSRVIGSGIGVTACPDLQKIVASNFHARAATENYLVTNGLPVVTQEESLYGDVLEVADRVAEQLRCGVSGAYVFGGEPTVVLPSPAGEGGRNQALAVALSLRLAGTGIIGLVAGTDGTDGPTNAAGGWFGELQTEPEIAEKALLAADSGRYLRDTERLFVTGPTGTNVMDLVVALKP